MKMFTPGFMREVFWIVSWVRANPVPKIRTGRRNARTFSHVVLIGDYLFALGSYLCNIYQKVLRDI